MKRILVLGHNGFIGNYLMKELAVKFPDVPLEGLSYPEIDLLDKRSVETLLPYLGKGTAVVMLAAIKRQFGDTLDTYEKNVLMTLNVARALEIASIDHFLFFSSMAVYGEDIHNLAIDEDTKIWPRSYYGLAKYTGEKILEKVIAQQGGIFTALRPPLIYGPGDEGKYVRTGRVFKKSRWLKKRLSFGETERNCGNSYL